MAMLARYKKPGAMIELVKLIESSPAPKRAELLDKVRSEDPAFAAEIESKLLTFEVIKRLPDNEFAEIVAATPVNFVALRFGVKASG